MVEPTFKSYQLLANLLLLACLPSAIAIAEVAQDRDRTNLIQYRNRQTR